MASVTKAWGFAVACSTHRLVAVHVAQFPPLAQIGKEARVHFHSGQNKRGHHFVWPAICCSRGFVRALGFRVTLRATPVGSWGPWAFAEPFVQSFVVASCTLFLFVELRNARRGSQNLRASNLVATQSADRTYLALIHKNPTPHPDERHSKGWLAYSCTKLLPLCSCLLLEDRWHSTLKYCKGKVAGCQF